MPGHQAERVRASRILTVPTALAPALGPVVGGILVTAASWQWVFYVNVPIGVAGFAFGALFLPEHRGARASAGSTGPGSCCRARGSARSCTRCPRVPTGAGPPR